MWECFGWVFFNLVSLWGVHLAAYTGAIYRSHWGQPCVCGEVKPGCPRRNSEAVACHSGGPFPRQDAPPYRASQRRDEEKPALSCAPCALQLIKSLALASSSHLTQLSQPSTSLSKSGPLHMPLPLVSIITSYTSRFHRFLAQMCKQNKMGELPSK